MDQLNLAVLALSILECKQGLENLVGFPWEIVSSMRFSVLF